MLSEVREAASEEREGRWAIQHAEDRDWPRLIQDHDWVARFHREQVEMGRRYALPDAAYELHHKQGTLFRPLFLRSTQLGWAPDHMPGRSVVTYPLLTRRDFLNEASDMEHCVAAYFPQRKSLIFSFRAPWNERATLELGLNGRVHQFYGPQNAPPSPRMRSSLDSFLALNKEALGVLEQEGTLLTDEEQKAMAKYEKKKGSFDDYDDDDY
jgi:hypothetical protein